MADLPKTLVPQLHKVAPEALTDFEPWKSLSKCMHDRQILTPIVWLKMITKD